MQHGKNYLNNSKNTGSNMDTVMCLEIGLSIVCWQFGWIDNDR